MTQKITGVLSPEQITTLITGGKLEAAEMALIGRMGRTGDDVWTLTALGTVYRTMRKFKAAEACYTRAILLDPDNANVLSNYGNVLVDLDRPEEALPMFEKILKQSPDSYVYHSNYAAACREAKKFKTSREHYEWCLNAKPDNADVGVDVAVVSMYMHDLDKGWDAFEHRLKSHRIRLPGVDGIPVWQGEKLKGKKLLVLAEQGFGDTMLLVRFLPGLVKQGAVVTLSCKKPLHKLFADLPVTLVDADKIANPKAYDFHIAMMSIPRLVEKEWANWPANPVFAIPEASTQKFAWLANHGKDKLKIGIVWSGSVTFAGNGKRAVDLSRFIELAAALPNVQFYGFQKGEREVDYKTQGVGTILPLGQMFDDFSETAAALKHMDAIVMTDSALVHLASTAGVPVIDLLPYLPYWLYTPETHDSALYPTLRFIRQDAPGAWDKVFATTKTVLADLSESRGKKALAVKDVLKTIDAHLAPAAKASAKPAAKAAPAKAKKR